MRTLHGVHMHGFPNLFMVQPAQAANFIANVPHNIVDHADTIATVVSAAEQRGAATVEPTADAEQAWLDLLATGPARAIGSTECTPGYYNNEGKGWGEDAPLFVGHPGGALAYFNHIDAWRKAGAFEGLEFG
jgi:hypothetical protein